MSSRGRRRALPALALLLSLGLLSLAPSTSSVAAPAEQGRPQPAAQAVATGGPSGGPATGGPATGGTAYLPGDLPGDLSGDPGPGARREAADEPDPRSLDYPSMPSRCATFREKVPLKPITCKIRWTNEKRPTLVLWGDSHLWQMLPAVRAAMKGKKVNLVAFIFGGCVPARPDMRIWRGQLCAETSALALKFLGGLARRDRPVRLVLGAYWGANLNKVYYFRNEGEKATHEERRRYVDAYTVPLFDWLGQRDIPTDVLAMGPVVVPPDPDCQPGPTPFDCDVARRHSLYAEAYTERWLRQRIRDLPRGARYIDYHSAVCNAAVCRARQAGSTYTWFDHYHLSMTLTSTFGRYFTPTVTRLLRQAARPSRPGRR